MGALHHDGRSLVNEGAAKAYRRQQRQTGQLVHIVKDGEITDKLVPGGNVKALWSSLSHKDRGRWRKKFSWTRAKFKRAMRHVAGRVRIGGVVARYPSSIRYRDSI